MRSPLDSLPPTRRKLIVALRMEGELSSDEAAARLMISSGAARQHLMALRAASLVEVRELRDGPGRPRHMFRLSPEADPLFPRVDARFVNNLLAAVGQDDPGRIDQAIAGMMERQLDTTQAPPTGKSLADRVESLREAFDRDGFLPAAGPLPDGRWQLSLFNCPLVDCVAEYPSFCACEARCIASACGDEAVTRVGFRVEGQRACTYLIGTPRPAASAPAEA